MFANKKNNYLLKVGAGIFFCTTILYSIINYYDATLIESKDKFGDFDSILLIFFSVIIIAPILEELIFRGFFLKKKIFTYLFFGGGILFTFIAQTYYVIILLFIIGVLDFGFKINRNSKIIYFLNSLFFALIHYNLDVFTNIYSIIPVFFQFSVGLILIWITINYSLIKSMIFHLFFNFLIVGSLLFALQFPDTKVNTIKDNNIVFTYHKTPVIGKEIFTLTPKEVRYETTTIRMFAKLLKVEEKNYTINDSLRFYRYNFDLKKTEGKELESEEVENILRKAKLIE